MIIIDVIQGSIEWLAARMSKRNASEAPVVAGVSKKIKRNELLHMKKTRTEKEVSDWVQENLFDKGHAAEALARPIAEEVVGEELYPVTASDDDGYLQASFDGLTMMEHICWEHKIWNEAKVAEVRAGRVPEEDRHQVVQQLVISGAEKCLYMVSDGTRENCVYVWYSLQPDDKDMLIRSWQQFDADLAAYEPKAPVVEAIGKAPQSLPALRIEVTGMVKASNLAEFKQTALAAISAVNTDLQTDQDFADAEKAIKWCKDVEERLEAAKQNALSQTASIEELFRTIGDITEETRQKRLSLNALVTAQKKAIRESIVVNAHAAMQRHIAALNESLEGRAVLPSIPADFATVIKGKRTIESLQNAADTELARAKVEANKVFDRMRGNLQTISTRAKGFEFLFADAGQLANKLPEDLVAVIDQRINQWKVDDAARIERERAAAKAAADAQAAAQARAAEQAQAAAQAQAQAQDPVREPDRAPAATRPAATVTPVRKPIAARPSDQDIIALVATSFRVHESKAIEWLLDMDLTAASTRMAANL